VTLFGNAGASVVAPDDPLGLRDAPREEGLTAAALAHALELFLDAFADELVRLRYAATRDLVAALADEPAPDRTTGHRGRSGSTSDAFALAARRAVRIARRAVAHDVRTRTPLLERVIRIVRSHGPQASVAQVADAILSDGLVPAHLRTAFGRGDGRYPLLFFEHGLVFRPTGVRAKRSRR
jgi:hypothetical protein